MSIWQSISENIYTAFVDDNLLQNIELRFRTVFHGIMWPVWSMPVLFLLLLCPTQVVGAQ